MRRYETIYILRPTLNEEQINTIVDNSNTIITEEKGQIIELDKWGMRKLAYPIKKEIQGYYVFCDYSGTPAAVSEMERKFRIDDSVLRYMTVKTDDSITEEEVVEAINAVSSKQITREEDTESTTDEEEVVEETADKED